MSYLSSLLILSKRAGQYWCWCFPIDLRLFLNSLYISQNEKKFYFIHLFFFYVVILNRKWYINRGDITIIYRIFGWDYMNIVVLKVRTVCFRISTSLFTRAIWWCVAQLVLSLAKRGNSRCSGYEDGGREELPEKFRKFSKKVYQIMMMDIMSCYTAGNWLFKVNNRNTRTRCEIYSKLTIKTPERRQWRRFGVSIVNFEQVNNGWVHYF